MKTLRITTHWTAGEAESIYQFLDDFKAEIWQHYGKDMVQMYKAIHDEQQADHQADYDESTFDDEIPF